MSAPQKSAPEVATPVAPEVLPDPLASEPEYLVDLNNPAPTPEVPKGRRAAAPFIFLTVALDMLAAGIIAPVLPRLIINFLNGNTVSAAQMLGLFGTLFAATQFFFSPVLGSLSDRFGRRPIVLISNFGLGLDCMLMAWAPALNWLFLGRVISGLTASSVPTAMAYMTDVTPREKRAAAFGMLNTAFGLGFVLGPALGGILGNVNPRLPFWASGVLSLINGCYGLLVLPESLRKGHRSPFSWKRANPIGSLSLLSRNSVLLGIADLLLLGYLAQQVLLNVYVIDGDYRYRWSDRTVGLSLAVVGICSGLYGALLVKPPIEWIGERKAMFFGYLGGPRVRDDRPVGHRAAGLGRHSLPEPDVDRVALGAEPPLAPSRTLGAGAAAGGGEQPARHRGTVRAGVVHLRLQQVHRARRPDPDPRHAVLRGRRDVDRRFGLDERIRQTKSA